MSTPSPPSSLMCNDDYNMIVEHEDTFESSASTYHDERGESECNEENDYDKNDVLNIQSYRHHNRYACNLVMKTFLLITTLSALSLICIMNGFMYVMANPQLLNNYRPSSSSSSAIRILNNQRHLQTNNTATNTNNQEKTEILCQNSEYRYNSIADLSYTYYLETKEGVDITQIIHELEIAMLHDLADSLLFCNFELRRKNRRATRRTRRKIQSNFGNGNSETNDYVDMLIDEFSLKIVGISSRPDDKPSTKSTCKPAMGRECTIVIGSLNLFLSDHSDLSTVQYATRYAIREIMSQDIYVGQIEGLEDVNYVGPNIVRPNQSSQSNYGQGNYSGTITYKKDTGISRLEVVLAATLISTIVGLLGSFFIFKRVAKQNCMAHCDGTAIDKEYIENCNTLGVTPVGEVGDSDIGSNISSNNNAAWNMNSLVNTSSNLSCIDENSVAASEGLSSMHSGAMSISTNKSFAMGSIGSVHSEQTMVIRNGRKNSTPAFGEYSERKNRELI